MVALPELSPERGPELSVVVPVLDEADNIAPLIAEIRSSLAGRIKFEIIYVDDGSTDATPHVLAAEQARCRDLRVVRHVSRCGQSTAIRSGVKAAQGAWIATLDGDGQNDPADIPLLLAVRPTNDGLAMIAGQRRKRQDSWSKKISSRIANRVRAKLLGDQTPDTGCGLKLFPRTLFLDLPYFDHMHRFLCALALREGVPVITVLVNHRPRLRGRSKYGLFDRLWVGIVDLFGVMWLQTRNRRPIVEGGLIDAASEYPADQARQTQ